MLLVWDVLQGRAASGGVRVRGQVKRVPLAVAAPAQTQLHPGEGAPARQEGTAALLHVLTQATSSVV